MEDVGAMSGCKGMKSDGCVEFPDYMAAKGIEMMRDARVRSPAFTLSASSVHFHEAMVVVEKVPSPRSPSHRIDGNLGTRIEAGALKVKKRFVGFQGVDRVKAAEIRRQLGIGDVDGKVGSPIAPYGWWTKSVTHN